MADSPHAFDAGDLRPRFSPTAIFPTASSAPTAAPIVPTDTSTSAAATSSSGTSVAGELLPLTVNWRTSATQAHECRDHNCSTRGVFILAEFTTSGIRSV